MRSRALTRRVTFGRFPALFFFLGRGAAAKQVQGQWDLGQSHRVGPEVSQYPLAEGWASAGIETSEGGFLQAPRAQVAAQWEAVLRQLDAEGQALLHDAFAEKERAAAAAAAAEKAAAMAVEGLAEKDSEIAALRTALLREKQGAMLPTKRRLGESTIRRLTVSGDSYTALSSLYNSTHGASWLTKTNWMSGDPCTASW